MQDCGLKAVRNLLRQPWPRSTAAISSFWGRLWRRHPLVAISAYPCIVEGFCFLLAHHPSGVILF